MIIKESSSLNQQEIASAVSKIAPLEGSSKNDKKALMPHPPADLQRIGLTNFHQTKSPALVSLEYNMRSINSKLT